MASGSTEDARLLATEEDEPEDASTYRTPRSMIERNAETRSDTDERTEGEARDESEALLVTLGGNIHATKEDEEPSLSAEGVPPLPSEAPSEAADQDDGWEPVWDASATAFYFYNRFSGASQWDNPRVPTAPTVAAPGGNPPVPLPADAPPATSGYNPAIHGDYDPNAWYAQSSTTEAEKEQPQAPSQDPSVAYAATAAFNRFTGRFQNADLTPENFNDENKSKRQMNAFFDVDAAANNHDGRSLKAERSGKKLSKTELKQFKEKRKMKKEEKRRAWLRD